MTHTITALHGIQVLDSRGRPTVCARMVLSDGSVHKATVPSGASTGRHEAKELRDEGTKFSEKFFSGSSVHQAVWNINNVIAPVLIGSVPEIESVDAHLIAIDGSPRHEAIGANASLAVSLAGAIAQAHSNKVSLARLLHPTGPLAMPMPMVNILSGGAHAQGALDIQDVLVIAHGAKNIAEALRWISSIRECATREGAARGFITNLVADEGGLGIAFASTDAACAFVVDCINLVGLSPESQVSLALDVAATQFFEQGNYVSRSSGKVHSAQQWSDQLLSLINSQPIISIEDPFAEDDWQHWSAFTAQVNESIQIIGDDLFTTQLNRLTKGIEEKSANSILIKPNQNGLVSKSFEVLAQAKAAGFSTVVSARSGESEDSWLADLALGWGAGQIKVGSTHGSERTAKWNRLLEIEATEETVFSKPF